MRVAMWWGSEKKGDSADTGGSTEGPLVLQPQQGSRGCLRVMGGLDVSEMN